ncbi:MAG: 3'-5' exonuclease, partial [Prevotella sp.]|nr:3'-5' exonuclease [Prevotella sp.]
VQEMKRFNTSLQVNRWITAIPKLNYIYRFLTDDVIDIIKAPSLKEQLDRYLMEITTFKEADLCGASTIDDRIFVTTIHKAKGLEFDNVIVFDVIDGRIPNYYNIGKPKAIAEDARKLYVAMSRVKHRLIISTSEYKKVHGAIQSQTLSRFLTSVRQFFKFRQPAL